MKILLLAAGVLTVIFSIQTLPDWQSTSIALGCIMIMFGADRR